jgi:hypothetical protein
MRCICQRKPVVSKMEKLTASMSKPRGSVTLNGRPSTVSSVSSSTDCEGNILSSYAKVGERNEENLLNPYIGKQVPNSGVESIHLVPTLPNIARLGYSSQVRIEHVHSPSKSHESVTDFVCSTGTLTVQKNYEYS